jgi:adenosylcobinamide-phosphate synthase
MTLGTIIEHYASIWVLWTAVVLHLIIPLSRDYHPYQLWRIFAKQLADKVNRPAHPQQSLISGSLAMLLMMLPLLALLIAFEPLVWDNNFYHLALLIIALDWRSQESGFTQLREAINREDKIKARELLGERLNRETQSLSLVGLGKAASETLIIGQFRQVICVLFWYAIGGGITAFSYRALAELHRTWSPSRATYSPFGIPCARVLYLFEWLPARLLSLLFLMGANSKTTWINLQQQVTGWSSANMAWLLISASSSLNLSIGGPVIYEDKKHVRTKLGGRIVPAALHLSQLQKQLRFKTLIWLAIQTLITIVITGLVV